MWSVEHSKEIYAIGKGDLDFLDIDPEGYLCISHEGKTIRLSEIVAEFKKKGGYGSFTLRMPFLIKKQVLRFIGAFEKAFPNYHGTFYPLYPIKVNQMKREVLSVINSSPLYGMEAGTKSEFVLLMKMLKNNKKRVFMCNGTKDAEYLSLIGKGLGDGYNIFISIERIAELLAVIEHIPKDKLKLILRIKPYVNLDGHWGSSSGRDSKFGLSVSELADVLKICKEHDLLDQVLGIHG